MSEPDEVVQLKQEVSSLRSRVDRIEAFLRSFPDRDLDQGEVLDELFTQAVKVISEADAATASLLQRRLATGYARSARILDQLEAEGLISPDDGSAKPRSINHDKVNDYLATTLSESAGEV